MKNNLSATFGEKTNASEIFEKSKRIEVSIIIPVYNEAENLKNIHDSLKELDYDKNFEIIYIDDGSTDESWEILQNFSNTLKVRCFKFNKNYPVGKVLAFGVEKADAKFVGVIGADCSPTVNWLQMVKHLNDKIAVIGFPVIPPADLDYLALKFGYNGNGAPDPNVFLHGSGILMRKDAVIEAGNYPVEKRVGEDTILFYKLIDLGYKIKYSEEATIYHKHRQLNFLFFLKRHYKTGINNKSKKTFIIFNVIFPILILFCTFGFIEFGKIGLITLLLPFGLLSNPLKIKYYMQNFRRPTNTLLKFLTFWLIKIAISGAFILGIWINTLKQMMNMFVQTKRF